MTHETVRETTRRPRMLISGGQTGVDRGALDAAIAADVPHGGWCPSGRLADDGPIPDRYELHETHSAAYAARTERNVLDADATLLLHRGPLTGGTALTERLARRHGRPCRSLDLAAHAAASPDEAASLLADLVEWLSSGGYETLNVAGPRESQQPGIQAETRAFLLRLLGEDSPR